MKGWIYIAANNRMPGLVKIGYTEKDPDERAKELSSGTGVPGNTEIKYMAWVEDVANIERQLHGRFGDTRDPGKEWFETEIADGIDALQTICKPILEDIRIPFEVVSCTKCGQKHRLRPNKLGTVLCKNSECRHEFFASTTSEADNDKRKIETLTDTLDRKLAELAEAKTLINQQNEEIEELEEQAETLVYAVCQNCGELNKMDWEYVDEEIELEDTLCPSCGYNLMPLTQLLEE